jgi:very-short-patch-repair endonuclease
MIEKQRLIALIEFAQHAARLRTKPASDVAQHREFNAFEHQFQGLPGVRLNGIGKEGEDEIWLSVDRLRRTKPPEVTSAVLKAWAEVNQNPDVEPRLRTTVTGLALIKAGTHRSAIQSPTPDKEQTLPAIDPEGTVVLDEYDKTSTIRAHFTAYVDNFWRPWSHEEKARIRSSRIYSRLFTIKQQLEGGIVDAPLELVWGMGIGVWNCDGSVVRYPLITRLVELSLNAESAAIEIRPRDTDPRLELDWYASFGIPGVEALEKLAIEFFSKLATTVSPFDRGTFEPVLQGAAAHLDPNGVFCPDEVRPEDRILPKADEKLRVTNTWVLFARPRTQNLFIQDLEKLKTSVETVERPDAMPDAVAAIVTDPAAENTIVELPAFRGVSAGYPNDTADRNELSSMSHTAADLYFPKPFNNEQVRIIQLLEVSDGVVVQGPPGTGKTHTIANVICHYLAKGSRILVTSMKEPALGVLQEKLPDEIHPLAISLLTTEQEGMRQFEFSIQKIASEVQSLDRASTAKAVTRLQESIDVLHGKLALIDRGIGEWAHKNLKRIELDGELIDPQDAAREIVSQTGNFEWIPDKIGILSEYCPQFGDHDVMRLREARRGLGEDIDYLDISLPQLADFPDTGTLLQVHQDLSRFAILNKEIESGRVPALADSSQEGLGVARELLGNIESLLQLRKSIDGFRRKWTVDIQQRLSQPSVQDLFGFLDSLGNELDRYLEERKAFLIRPVTVPTEMENNHELVVAIANLAQGKRPFGLGGVFGKSALKEQVASVRILGKAPSTDSEWKHVQSYLTLQAKLRELALKWNALATDLGIESVEESPKGAVAAVPLFSHYEMLKQVVALERTIAKETAKLFPEWSGGREVITNSDRLSELDRVLRDHLTKIRLSNVWAIKEQFETALENRAGRVVQDVRSFLSDVLGNPNVPHAKMQSSWSTLMGEIARIHALSSYLSIVQDISDKVSNSGAPQYARLLRQPLKTTADPLLPDSWRQSWRLKRLDTYLNSIEAHEELKRLTKSRTELEADLARAYRDIVVKKTWLKLAENASPKIRAALQSFLNAIQRIGKGTGKRAIRYRQDARNAAAEASSAVPCWIMPHYRVSESLPPELGCFELVIIDEASQSDLSALPALLRAKKVLIVGDDKQVSPEGVGLEEDKIRSLMNRFLSNQVPTYRPQMSPERSMYDLFKVVFARSGVMLKEHFRCAGPIIEFSKREFYNHELRPLRLPQTSERLDPPLIDVVIEDGRRQGDENRAEIRFIVSEIQKIVADPTMSGRSIGVVSLLGEEQAYAIWERLSEELGPELIVRHQIACGDARTFQGKERDIMFLTMVSAPNDVGAALSRDTFAQRFNVAASRARDRMYLVRSVELEHLSPADGLRRNLISHFATPFAQDEEKIADRRKLCESPFEREIYDELVQRGFQVMPQLKVGQYRIDMVVEGDNDARLAVECDGDRYDGPDKWVEDMQRQRVLERAGWVFWRCFASTYLRRRNAVLNDLIKTLSNRGIEPFATTDAKFKSVRTEQRRIRTELSQGAPA